MRVSKKTGFRAWDHLFNSVLLLNHWKWYDIGSQVARSSEVPKLKYPWRSRASTIQIMSP